MSAITPEEGPNFAARLFEQLLPFQSLDSAMSLYAFCDGIGAMFQPVEDLTAARSDGLSGWANLVDINNMQASEGIPLISKLAYVSQFAGVDLVSGYTDEQNRQYLQATPTIQRGRPAATLAAISVLLTGTKLIIVRERDGSAWRYSIITRASETPNPDAIRAIILSQKPLADIATYTVEEYIDYQWVKDHEASYANLKGDFVTYNDLATREIT